MAATASPPPRWPGGAGNGGTYGQCARAPRPRPAAATDAAANVWPQCSHRRPFPPRRGVEARGGVRAGSPFGRITGAAALAPEARYSCMLTYGQKNLLPL
jgi:hypothetical protein